MTLLNVSDVVSDPDVARTLTVRRVSGSWIQGKWINGTPSEFTAKGSWQRVTPRELAQLDMGEIKQEVRKFLTTTEIKVSEDNDLQSDRIIWTEKSARYKVIRVDDNDDYGFYRAYAAYEGTES